MSDLKVCPECKARMKVPELDCPNCDCPLVEKEVKRLMGEPVYSYFCGRCGEEYKLVSVDYLESLEDEG